MTSNQRPQYGQRPYQPHAQHNESQYNPPPRQLRAYHNKDPDQYYNDAVDAQQYQEEYYDSLQSFDNYEFPYSEDITETPLKYNNETVEAQFMAPTVNRLYKYCRCKKTFKFKNELHTHLQNDHGIKKGGDEHALSEKNAKAVSSIDASSPPIVETNHVKIVKSSIQKLNVMKGYTFRGWKYATAKARFTVNRELQDMCLDTGCIMSLINRQFLKSQSTGTLVEKISTLIKVKGIGSIIHQSDEYALLDVYLPGDSAIAHIRQEFHLVKNLKANVLIGIDILGSEGIDVLLMEKTATIRSCCGIQIPISVELKRMNQVNWGVFSKELMMIPPATKAIVPVQGPKRKPFQQLLPVDQDFLFEPDMTATNASVYTHVVDHEMLGIQVFNDTATNITIPKGTQMGTIVEYKADGCFLVDAANAPLSAAPGVPSEDVRNIIKTYLSDTSPAGNLETKLSNGVTIYRNANTTMTLSHLSNKFSDVFEDTGEVAEVSESEWMDIPLQDDWQTKYKAGQARVYGLSTKDKEVVNMEFDKLQEQGKLTWSTTRTPFMFPCFIVWKTLPNNTKKGRVVVDIRALNKITVPNTYPAPLQSDILAAIHGSKFISTIDCSSFFHQWRVNPRHRHRLTVSSHRGQEVFNVAVMGYRNSPAYVQRMINSILRGQHKFARAYVDDIIVFSATLEEHLNHL